jgi:site-specific recombinase XerD
VEEVVMGVTKLETQTAVPLADLAESWLVALEAQHKSAATLRLYQSGVSTFLRWHASKYPLAEPVLDKPAVTAFLADLRKAGKAPATCHARYAALRRFSAWLYEEGEAETDALDKMKPPKLDKPVVPRLSEEELAALVQACRGTGFIDRRDEALVRLMTEGLLRASEALGLTVADVDVRRGLALVRRGKGGKGRMVPFGPETGRALDRYLRIRRRHPLAHTAPLWLPGAGRPRFGYQGLARSIGERAQAAGIERFHLHRLRHTGASRWLRAGGTPTALRAVGGWANLDMVQRYTEDDAAAQAIEEARRLGLDRLG